MTLKSKRSWLKRKTKLRKRSPKGDLIQDCIDLYREIFFITRGRKCQFCGREENLGVFHILNRSSHPKLILCELNMLIACWLPCHNAWHKDRELAAKLKLPEKINNILGVKNYETHLKTQEAIQPKITMNYLALKKIALEQELAKLKKKPKLTMWDKMQCAG